MGVPTGQRVNWTTRVKPDKGEQPDDGKCGFGDINDEEGVDDEDCKGKTELCERAQCVTNQWSKNRDNRSENDAWNDVKGELERLSEDINKNEGSMRTHCKGNSDEDSRIVTDIEKRACRYITAGLKHIYNIQANSSEKEKGNEHLDNQLFKRTMSCLLLNAYADKLEREVKSPCKVDKGTTEQAFDRWNKQRDTWCVDSDKSKCFMCERLKGLSCTVGGTEVKETLKTMIDDDANIRQSLTTLNNINNSICNRSQCVTTQRTRDKRDERDAKRKAQGITGKASNQDRIWEVWKGFILNIAV
ncbi:SICA antigen [Plasmodium coatneyi]|uniref:SICA antigen n=1 Tax=Plasmodium coatneyi TaxID=208452 RepID=A0A1B1DT78_9APIC|nr:SICA antigen [Plasmodium coatneyi]ANQ05991.1 SICA antigen [Plasmodium coatneyi]